MIKACVSFLIYIKKLCDQFLNERKTLETTLKNLHKQRKYTDSLCLNSHGI